MLSSTSADRNDALASLLATATVALDTDRRAAKSCIQRAAALLEIDLSSEGDGTAGHSCLSGRSRTVASQAHQVFHRGQTGL